MLKRAMTCLALVGCSASPIPSMHPASGAAFPRPTMPGEATVVFVRPPSSCDTIEYPSIVDENGHFVGNAGANTRFSVNVPAGRHAFYVWPHIDAIAGERVYYERAGAILVDASPGSVTRIAIELGKGRSLRCDRGGNFRLVAHDATDADRAQLALWERDTIPTVPETEAGERDLQRNPGAVCARVEDGRQQLAEPPPTKCGSTAPVADAPR